MQPSIFLLKGLLIHFTLGSTEPLKYFSFPRFYGAMDWSNRAVTVLVEHGGGCSIYYKPIDTFRM